MAAEEMPEPIRRDVGLLGRLLGRVLEESGGTELLADVERLRRAALPCGKSRPKSAARASNRRPCSL